MSDEKINRLRDVLKKHQPKILSIKKFDEYFDEIKIIVDKNVQKVNVELQEFTGDNLSISWVDVENLIKRKFFVRVKIVDPDIINNPFAYAQQDIVAPPTFEIIGMEETGLVNLRFFEHIDDNDKRMYQIIFEGKINEIPEDTIFNALVDLIDKSYS